MFPKPFIPVSQRLHPWVEAARPRTLPAAASPVVLASALALQQGHFAFLPALVCLLFALSLQVATNFANDYADFLRGADTPDRKGPTRAVASGLVSLNSMKKATIIALSVAFVIGCMIIPFSGWWMIPLGLLCIFLAWAYTSGPLPLAYNGLGDLFVILFFGFVAVVTTYFIQSRELALEAWLLGLACGTLSTNLLVVNNVRDRETDARCGKKTLAVRWGRDFSLREYLVFLLIPLGVNLVLALLTGQWLLLLVFLMIPWGTRSLDHLFYARSRSDYALCLKSTAGILVAYTLITSFALVLF